MTTYRLAEEETERRMSPGTKMVGIVIIILLTVSAAIFLPIGTLGAVVTSLLAALFVIMLICY